jgi:flagellar biosynthesis/type III secretory pathway protein FliH
MNEMKIAIGDGGQTVVVHSTPIETRCADNARSIHALTDLLTAPENLARLANSAPSQQEIFRLLRTLTQEQQALTAALQQQADPNEREEAFRRAFRSGYSAGLQRTSSANEEIDMTVTAAVTPYDDRAPFEQRGMQH